MKADICLCLIVKNESHIIKQTFDGIFNCVDNGGIKLTYWVICDTGSTDGTQQLIIDYFKEKGVPGELLQHEWKNFGHNRTLAFQACENGNAKRHSTYMWVIDADDVPRGKFVIPSKLYKDKYNLKYRSGTMAYVRPQLFKIGLGWEYIGALHEFAEPTLKDNPTVEDIEGDYYIDSRRLGDRSLNPLKYYKDGKILVKEYEDSMKLAREYSGIDKLNKLLEKLAEANGEKILNALKKRLEEVDGTQKLKQLENLLVIADTDTLVSNCKDQIKSIQEKISNHEEFVKSKKERLESLKSQLEEVNGKGELKRLISEFIELKKNGEPTDNIQKKIDKQKEFIKLHKERIKEIEKKMDKPSSKQKSLMALHKKLARPDLVSEIEVCEGKEKSQALSSELEKEMSTLKYHENNRGLYDLKEIQKELEMHKIYMNSKERNESVAHYENLIREHNEKYKNVNTENIMTEIKNHKAFISSQKTKRLLRNAKYLATRCSFYAGQSFRDYGDTEYSRFWYDKRGKNPIKTHDEEAYQARMEVAIIDMNDGASPEKVEEMFMSAFEMYPFAAEPFYKMAVHFNLKEDFERAYKWGKKAWEIPFPTQAQLFVQKDVYEYRAAKEYGYAAYKLGKYDESYDAIENALVNRNVPVNEIRYLENIRNMNYQGNKLVDMRCEYPEKIVRSITTNNKSNVTFVMSYQNEKSLRCLNSFLKCCKDVNQIDRWVVYGNVERPDFGMYPFLEYVKVNDGVDVLSLSRSTYTIYMDGVWTFVFGTEYILPHIQYMRDHQDVKQIKLLFQSGEDNGDSYNKSKISLDVPSIMQTEGINEDSVSLSRRMFSCIKNN